MISLDRNTFNQFKKFLVIGFASTVINYAVFYLSFSAKLNYLAASSSGYVSGLVFGYFFNRNWTFGAENRHNLKEVFSYVAVYACSLVLSILFLKFLVEVLAFLPLIGNIFAIGLSTITNFIGCKFFVFKKC